MVYGPRDRKAASRGVPAWTLALISGAILTGALGAAPLLAADDGGKGLSYPRHDEDSFEVGGSCAALAYLDQPQLKQLVRTAFADDFHSFCYPEDPFSCSDYTSFLKGVGRMTIGDDGYHCSVQLQP